MIWNKGIFNVNMVGDTFIFVLSKHLNSIISQEYGKCHGFSWKDKKIKFSANVMFIVLMFDYYQEQLYR